MKPMFKSIACILSLAAISAGPLHAEKVDWETAKQRVDAILAEREKERENAARQPATLDIVETAEADGSFKTLSAAIEAAGLTDTLKGKGPFTVFAPTDKAFAKLPAGTVENLLKPENKAQLIDLLTKHVVAGEFPLSKALEAGEGTTLQGSMFNVRFDKGRVKIDNSTIVNADTKTTNGLIHVIDTVLIPSPSDEPAPVPDANESAPADKDIVDTAASIGTFKRLAAALTATDLVDTLRSEGPFTVFAPTDDAFSKFQAGFVDTLLRPENKELLLEIISNHVAVGEIPLSKAVEAGEANTLLQGSKLKVRLKDGLMKAGTGTLTQADIKTTNGLIHVVDTVLQPSPFLAPKGRRLEYDIFFTKKTALYSSVDIVLVFTDSESDLGKMLDEKIFLNDDFLEAARENFVVMKVENPRNKFLLSASEREENPGLWKEYGVDVDGNTPTILLCDQDGVTYATTDYSNGSAADFLKQLNRLHAKQAKEAKRAKRD